MVVLKLLLEERDGGGSVEDDPRLRGSCALAAAVRAADCWDAWGSEENVKKRREEKREKRPQKEMGELRVGLKERRS